MRSLEFRAWDGKKMIEDVVPASESYIIEVYEYEYQYVEVEAVEQYTGLKDKNGKEVYEGDIVSVRNKNRKNEYDIGVVEFGKAAFRCPFLLGKYHSGQVEVIGNIHENTDLLGGQIMAIVIEATRTDYEKIKHLSKRVDDIIDSVEPTPYLSILLEVQKMLSDALIKEME